MVLIAKFRISWATRPLSSLRADDRARRSLQHRHGERVALAEDRHHGVVALVVLGERLEDERHLAKTPGTRCTHVREREREAAHEQMD